MKKYTVTKDGIAYATFNTAEQAEAYADMMRRGMKGAGVWKGALRDFPDAKKAMCARSSWAVT